MHSESYIQAVRMDLEEALRWGHTEETDRMREEIREYEDYRNHCQEKQWERDAEDARFESYWEARI